MGGEQLAVPERVVLAPTAGRFRSLPPDAMTTEGEIVVAGQAIAVVECGGDHSPVTSQHTGFLMGLLAAHGERVRAGQPVAWLRTVAP
jgi:biotin carboxyl carrier protein